MEFNLNFLDSFPSLNKIPQKNNLFLEFNNKEYSLDKLITQQEIIPLKKSLSKLFFKIYFIVNSKKLLIGLNSINQESIKFDTNKIFTTWIEFRKRIPDNNKDINDINFLFFDCLRLKLKISLIKSLPKTDKRIKKTQSRIKLGAKTPIIPKKADDKFKLKNDNNEINIDNDDNNNLNSYRNFDTNYLLKSKSQEENIKLVSEELENIKVNTNNIMEKYNNLRIKSEESISHEMKNLLQIENDCLLTDNNLLENYSYSTSLGDNNNKNIIKSRVENENKMISDIIKNDINYEFIPKNNLLSLNNYKSLNKQEQNMNQMNDSLNDEIDTNKKTSSTKTKFKGISKLIKINDKKQDKKIKQIKNNNINKSNSNNIHSLIKEKIYFNSNTYNNFYKKNMINDENNHLDHLETNIYDNNNNKNKNVFMNNLLISHKTKLKESEIIKEEKINMSSEYEDFISMKKDYELLYTPAFIKEIKKDLLDLEFNIALEKSISLFLLYNNHISLFFKQKKELLTIIKNYMKNIDFINKKQILLDAIKKKEKNKLLLNDLDNNINLKRNYLAQKNIFENLINDKINKKQTLKIIISILLKKNNNILDNLKTNKNLENENLKTNIKSNSTNKFIIKSPSRSINKTKIKSPQTTKQKQKYEFMSEIKNKNSIFANKLINKKKASNHNLKKNKSINYLVSLENINERNIDKSTNKDSKPIFSKNNLIYYSTAKNKFYNAKYEQGK